MLFADDLILFCHVAEDEAQVNMECLRVNGRWSGQSINMSKSKIHFSKNVNVEQAMQITGSMGLNIVDQDLMYLVFLWC